MDKISVIVPVYNTDKYLDKCLESIIHQTYQNLEIICVDDGSTDGSAAILHKYADTDNRIIVISQNNQGIAYARDTGLQAATGDWITYVDSDDWLSPDMYKKMIRYGEQNPADILACGYLFSRPEEETEAINTYPVPAGTQDIRTFLYYIYCRDDYKGVASYLWNKLFRASVIKNQGEYIRFDLSLGNQGEDIEWAARCFMNAKSIAYLPEPLYHYSVRPDSSFHSLEQRLATLQHIHAYEKVIALYREKQIDEQILDYLERFYVYHLGVLMEYAQRQGAKEKAKILREKATPCLPAYIRTNQDHPERIRWIKELFT